MIVDNSDDINSAMYSRCTVFRKARPGRPADGGSGTGAGGGREAAVTGTAALTITVTVTVTVTITITITVPFYTMLSYTILYDTILE